MCVYKQDKTRQDKTILKREALVELPDNIMFYLVIILFGIGCILVSVINNYVNKISTISNPDFNHGSLEVSI